MRKLSRRNKRRKREDYREDLPQHKDYNIGHWRGHSHTLRERICNGCGKIAVIRSKAHKRWCKKEKKMVHCGSYRLNREPVYIKIKEEEE